jgi:hypothetical protein
MTNFLNNSNNNHSNGCVEENDGVFNECVHCIWDQFTFIELLTNWRFL